MLSQARRCSFFRLAIQSGIAAWTAFAARSQPALAQDAGPGPTESPEAASRRRTSYGAEITLGSGHADRGFVIDDRPVVQPVAWVSGRIAEFSWWASFPLAQTTDSARPRIMELELTHPHRWGRLTIAPAIRMFFYHDALSVDRDRSIEGWLTLSYDAGPVRLFTNHSLDVLTYRGAYFGEAGIESERRVSRRVELGGSLGVGWASATFNQAYADIAKSALDRLKVEGWLLVHLTPHGYLGPRFEVNTIVDHGVRAELTRPTFALVGLTTGVEF